MAEEADLSASERTHQRLPTVNAPSPKTDGTRHRVAHRPRVLRGTGSSPRHRQIRKASVLGRILALAGGTVATRAVAAASQFVLAIWLSPAEFGHWATAIAWTAIFSGLMNFGEVNGYLAGQTGPFARVRRTTRVLNTTLAVGAAVLGLANLGRPEIAVLIWVASATIIVQGESEVLYAGGVRTRQTKTVVGAQTLAALVKLATGVAIAAATSSALSLAISTALFFVVMDLAMARIPRRLTEETFDGPPVALRQRASWSLNTFMVTATLQAGFLTASAVSSAAVLGIFYFSYQVSVGISGLIAVPLMRTTLDHFRGLAPAARPRAAAWLATTFGAGLAVPTALVLVIAPFAGDLLARFGDDWIPAIPCTAVLLASLPARIATPVLDSLQQSNNRWGRSTALNAVDAAGTALAGLVGATGHVLYLCLAITVWKALIAAARTLIGLPIGLRDRLLAAGLPLVFVALACIAAAESQLRWPAVGGLLVVLAGWAAWSVTLRRPTSSVEPVEH